MSKKVGEKPVAPEIVYGSNDSQDEMKINSHAFKRASFGRREGRGRPSIKIGLGQRRSIFCSQTKRRRKRATHAIGRLRDQRMLARVDGAGIVRAGEYALTRLATWPPDLDLGFAPAVVRQLAARGLWLEQERIVLDPRMAEALEAVLAPGDPGGVES